MLRKSLLILFFSFLGTTLLYAQKKDIVSLVAIGAAPSRDGAISSALRSAIEQTYGAFISSQTRILNDKLISDEVVSVSSGNIRKYTVLSETQNGNNYLVSINAEVSVSKLANFAESHGQSCLYNGDLLSNNIQLMRLRAENTTKCINNLIVQLTSLYSTAFDFKIDEIGSPIFSSVPKYNNENYRKDRTGCYYFPVYVSCVSNKSSAAICKLVRNTFRSLSVSSDESKDIENFIGLTHIPALNITLAGNQDFLSVSNLLDKCLYDITLYADGISEMRTSLLSLLKRETYFVQYEHVNKNGKTTIHEYLEPSPFKRYDGWNNIEKELKEGKSYDNYIYVYEPRYQWYAEGFGYNEYTTFGEKFLLNEHRSFNDGKINKFESWDLNKKKSQVVYRIKLYVKIPEYQLSNFKGFSVKR